MRANPSLILLAAIVLSIFAGRLDAQIMRSPSLKNAAAEKASELSWPNPVQLLKELSPFEKSPITQAWAIRTKELAQHLCTNTEVTDDAAVQILMALHQQSQGATNLINEIGSVDASQRFNFESAELISELQRFQYRLDRRIEIWAGVIDHAKAIQTREPTPIKTVSLSGLPRNLDILPQREIPGNVGWQDYLAWDDLVKASHATNMDKKARLALRNAARKFLARYHSPALSDAQRERFQPFFSPEILAAIQGHASQEVSHTKLMKLIEGLEQKDSGRLAHYLNSEYQNLLWSDDPIANELAAKVDSHWRNANVRFAVNERLINQMLPQMPAMTEPVSERIQGAKVSGQSHIENQLRIALIPNPNEISIGLETIGHVESETVAQRSGFTFQNRGLADFKVFQKLAFSRTGVTSEEALVSSSARQRLIGLRGSFDRVPLLGRLTRMIAQQKAEEQTPEAIELTKERVESGAKQRVEQEVNQVVSMLRRGLHDHVLSKLIAMDLEPETVQLGTSEQRVFGRFRVAGRDQMAARQPRPTDFESDLLTVQFHQSAINNLIQRFGLNGEEFNAITLGQHIEKITNIPYQPGNTDTEATFQFAKYDGIRVDFEEGMASVKFSFKKFQIGKGRPWKNIAIKANFKPKYIGTRIVLDREDLFELESTTGKKKDLSIGDEIAIRTAFKIILDKQYAFDLVPAVVRGRVPNLALGIDRFSLAEGWCSVALDNAANLGQPVPIIEPEAVVPGSWSDQLGKFQTEDARIKSPRTARRLGF